MDSVWMPNWLLRLMDDEDDKELDYEVIKKDVENMSGSGTMNVVAAKTRLTQVIDTTLESALVLQGTISDNTGNPISTWTGSGFLIQSNIAITNAHTLVEADMTRNEEALIIVSLDGEDFYKTRTLALNEEMDIGIIEILDFPGHQYLPLGDSDLVEVGEMIVVLGAPEGWANTATIGYIMNIDMTLESDDPSFKNIFFTDAFIASGSSGAAVVDMQGEVIGVIVGIIGEHSQIGVGVNAIIPISKAKELLMQNNIVL